MNYIFIIMFLEDFMIIKGIEKNSGTYFKDNLYFVSPEQIYMYNLKPHLNYCFIKPLKNQRIIREQERAT